MTAESPEKKAETNLKGKTLLAPGMVNLVGESHDLSQAARGLEKEFVKDMMGPDAGYWTEDEFRAKRGERDAGQRERAADPMELRSAQATAEAIDQFYSVCYAAVGCADFDAVMVFVAKDLNRFLDVMNKLLKTWDAEQASVSQKSQAVFKAVTSVLAFFKATTQQFQSGANSAVSAGGLDAVKKAYIKVVRGLGKSSDKLPALTQQLAAAVGSSQTDAGALAKEINVMRSKSMAKEVASSDLAGVWKVGDQHIKDLTADMAEAEINRITEDAFEEAFGEWAERQHHAEWVELQKEWAKLREQRPTQQAETGT
jgi:hypothetical protein